MIGYWRALPAGGRVVHQFFSTDRDPYTPTMVALQQFFPGSILSRHETIMAVVRQAGFRVETETLDEYRPTLRAWFDNLVANKDAAVRLVGVQTYNKYLIFFPASWRFFQNGHARLHRILLTRP